MPSEVILPRVDMDMATGKISKWLVAPGTAVAKGQPLFEIETDKATMEIEAEADGTIRTVVDASAKDIPVGSVVAWIYAANESTDAVAPAGAPGAGTAAGGAEAAADGQQGARPANGAAAPEQAPGVVAQGARTRATPLARRLARENAIELGSLRGSGPRGRIRAADVVGPSRRETAATTRVGESPHSETPVSSAAAPPSVTPAALAPAGPDAGLKLREPSRTEAVAPSSHPAAPGGLRLLREGTGRPLLLVHGFGSEANGWRPFLQGASLTRPVFGLDLPGHGGTALGQVGSFEDLIERVQAGLAGLESAVDVAAHSLGAAVMTAVAARSLLDVRSLLLLSPAGLGPDINGSFLHGFLDATSEAGLAAWMGELVADPRAINPSLVRASLKARAGTDQVAAQRQLAAVMFPGGAQSFSIRAELAALRIPTRIVFGAADRIIPARHAVGLPPLVGLHLLPNVGHMPQLEARDVVATLLAHNAPA